MAVGSVGVLVAVLGALEFVVVGEAKGRKLLEEDSSSSSSSSSLSGGPSFGGFIGCGSVAVFSPARGCV